MHTLPSDRYVHFFAASQLLLMTYSMLFPFSLHSLSAWNFQEDFVCRPVQDWLAALSLSRQWMGLFCWILTPWGLPVRWVNLSVHFVIKLTIQYILFPPVFFCGGVQEQSFLLLIQYQKALLRYHLPFGLGLSGNLLCSCSMMLISLNRCFT